MKQNLPVVFSSLFFSMTALASDCPDLKGHYIQKFMGTPIMKIDVKQDACESFTYTSTLPTGETMTQTLILDGVERVVGQDPETGLIHFETATVDSRGVWLKGRTTENGKLKYYWNGSWTLNSRGALVDSIDGYDADGTPQGPYQTEFERL